MTTSIPCMCSLYGCVMSMFPFTFAHTWPPSFQPQNKHIFHHVSPLHLHTCSSSFQPQITHFLPMCRVFPCDVHSLLSHVCVLPCSHHFHIVLAVTLAHTCSSSFQPQNKHIFCPPTCPCSLHVCVCHPCMCVSCLMSPPFACAVPSLSSYVFPLAPKPNECNHNPICCWVLMTKQNTKQVPLLSHFISQICLALFWTFQCYNAHNFFQKNDINNP